MDAVMPDFAIETLITTARIVPRLRARHAREVVHALAARISADTDVAKRAIVAGLVPGADFVISPATGVALLHAFVPGITSPIAAFATLDTAVNFNAADGRSSDLIVLLVSPDSGSKDHLPALARLARRLRDRGARQRLRVATSADAIYAILADMDGAHGEPGEARQRFG
jgi:nitrogen PTS system EIIA component